MLIVAGTLLLVIPPVIYFLPEIMFRQNPLMADTFYVSRQFNVAAMATLLGLFLTGLGMLITGSRIVLKAP